MTGNIRFCGIWTVPTRPDLWQQVKSESDYFATLRKLQIKPENYELFQIPDQEPNIIPGGI